MPSKKEKAKLPLIVFEGWKVHQALTPAQQKRISTETVADVLDAVVRVLRQETTEAEGEVDPNLKTHA